MDDDLGFIEETVYPLLVHVTAYLRRQPGNTRNKRREVARMRQWVVDALSFTRSAYRRPLRQFERAQLQSLLDKIFAQLPRPWQRIGLPPTP